MAKRLIDAVALEARLCELCDEFGTDHLFIDAIIDEIDNAPTISGKEAISCRNCKHYDLGVCLKIYSDGAGSAFAWQGRKSTDFCSYGERKEG